MIRTLGAALGASLLLPASVLAQDAIVPGTRVKVRVQNVPGIESAQPTELRGTVVNRAADTLVLSLEPSKAWRHSPSPVFAIPFAAVSAVAVYRGRGPQPLRGAKYGLAGGIALGLSVLSLLCGEEDLDPGAGDGAQDTCTLSDVGAILLLSAALGVVGGVGGLVVGTVVGGDRWKPVALERLHVSARRVPGHGVGLGLSFSF